MIGILIVDDNVRLREAVRAELEAQEHVCSSARPETASQPANSPKVSGRK